MRMQTNSLSLQAPTSGVIVPLHGQRLQTCAAQYSPRSAFSSRIICRQAQRSSPKTFASVPNSEGGSSADRRSEDTLNLLDSLLGSLDEGETAGSTNPQTSVNTSSADQSDLSETIAQSASLQQASAPLQGELYTGTRSVKQRETPPVAHTIVQLAKDFLLEKLRRPTAQDLIVDEDAAALPRIKPRLAYLLLAINIGVYAAGLVAGFGPEGADAQQDYFLALAKTDTGVEAGEYYRCFAFSSNDHAYIVPAVASGITETMVTYLVSVWLHAVSSLCRLITANFLHDSFVHLGASCYALATVAPAIEEVLGWDIFLATYMLSSVGGSVGTFILGDAVTVGASSGIFGLVGALVAYLWKNRSLERTSQQLTSIAGVVGVNLVMGGIQETSIDNIGHAAGMLVGAYLGYGLSPTLLPAKDNGSKDSARGLDAEEEREESEVVDVMHVDHGGALRRWAGYVSFSATLALLTAGTIVMRTGELPAPKGLELLVF